MFLNLFLLYMIVWGIGFFFFFQAEDGIRDGRVTGVQTCALPIYAVDAALRGESGVVGQDEGRDDELRVIEFERIGRASCREECRSRWSPDHSKKKKENVKFTVRITEIVKIRTVIRVVEVKV